MLTCISDDEHKSVFPDVPMIGFKNNKYLKVHLVRSQCPTWMTQAGPNRVKKRDLFVIYVKI